MKYDRTVFIHIGIHKTGSTAIQRFLRDDANRGLLRTYGYHNIQPRFLLKPTIEQIQGCDSEIIEKEKRECLELIENTEHGNLVISSEHFSGDVFSAYSEASLWAKTLHSIFGSNRVKIIAYLRRQDHFIEALYNNSIRVGCEWTFADFCDVMDIHGFNWYKHLTQYAQYFGKGNIIVRPYETIQLQDGNVVPDFFGILGIPSDAIQARTPQWDNIGYGRSALELARICNSALNRDDGVLIKEALDQLQAMQQSGDHTRSPFDVRRELLDYFKKNTESQARLFRIRNMLHSIDMEGQFDDHVSLASAMRSRFLHSSEKYDATRDLTRIRMILQALNTKRPFDDYGFFSSAERLKLLDYYDESNSQVAHEFLAREDGRLFWETVAKDDGLLFQQQGLSTDELAVIVMNIFLKLDTRKEVSDVRKEVSNISKEVSNIRKELSNIRKDTKKGQLYTIILVGEIERLAIKILVKLGIKDFLYRLYRRGFKIIKRL